MTERKFTPTPVEKREKQPAMLDGYELINAFLPPRGHGSVRGEKYPFAKLQVNGPALFVPDMDSKRISSLLTIYGKRHSMKFRARNYTNESGISGVLVFRVG